MITTCTVIIASAGWFHDQSDSKRSKHSDIGRCGPPRRRLNEMSLNAPNLLVLSTDSSLECPSSSLRFPVGQTSDVRASEWETLFLRWLPYVAVVAIMSSRSISPSASLPHSTSTCSYYPLLYCTYYCKLPLSLLTLALYCKLCLAPNITIIIIIIIVIIIALASLTHTLSPRCPATHTR